MSVAEHGYSVVVNDLGVGLHGEASGESPADAVVRSINDRGGSALASGNDISDWQAAGDLVGDVVDRFGRLDVGIIRDSMLFKLSEHDWDDVIRAHLRGTAAVSHFAAVHWRERFRADGAVDGRLINTTSASGLYGNVGQTNYSAAKSGIVGFTLSAALELDRYGVTANVISPLANSRMLGSVQTDESREVTPSYDPAHVAKVATWLCSTAATGITGRVFSVNGRHLYIGEGWNVGPSAAIAEDATVADLDAVLPDLVRHAAQHVRSGSSSHARHVVTQCHPFSYTCPEIAAAAARSADNSARTTSGAADVRQRSVGVPGTNFRV
jgi:NAD(P)-dependent dehydrogenase (short-subunit alcohol dehydrogenase family)